MKLTVKGSDLRGAAAWAAKIAPSNPPSPVMAGVKLTAGDDLALAAADYETFGTARCAATVQDAGSAVVSARLLTAVAKVVTPTADVTLMADGAQLEIRAGRATWKLPELEGDLWPQFPSPGEPLGRIDGAALEDSLSRVAVAADDGKMNQEILRGVHMVLGDALTLTATNAYRLAHLPIDWTRTSEEQSSAIVPAGVLRHIGADGDVTISSDGSVLGLSTWRFTVLCRLIAGTYKNVTPIMAGVRKNAATTVTVDVQELRSAIESAAILLGETGHLALDFGDEAIEVSKVGGDGDATASVDVQGFTGDPISIAVKAEYVKDMLAALQSPSALFTFTGKSSAGFLVQPCTDNGELADDYCHLLMPLKLGGK